MDSMCFEPKMKRTVQTCYQQSQKPWSILVRVSVTALGKGHLDFCDVTLLKKNYIEIMCCLEDYIYY